MIKRNSSKILLILLLSMFATAASAHDIEVANADGVTIYYNWINNNTELEVVIGGTAGRFYKYVGSVNIPESVEYEGENYKVTSIGKDAFDYCGNLTSITIPNTVLSIGSSAFHYCSGLTSVIIGNGVTSIGSYVFFGCSSLNSVTIPNSVTSIGDGIFSYCSDLTSIKVESGNSVYDSRDNCNAIIEKSSNTLIAGCKSTTIPNSVTSIDDVAFEGCDGLISVNIPSSVTSIGNSVFYGCSGLTSVTIPNSVTSIGLGAFRYCSGLTSIKVESGNSVYDSRDNCNAIIGTKSNTLIAGCKTTTIPNSVISIGIWAFTGCSGLTSVTIPNSVTSIGEFAFSDCSGLTSISIPNSVKSIGEGAFHDCSLTSVISEIKAPFAIDDYVFKSYNTDVYATAILTVPAVTKAKYQSTDGWKQFKNIVEAGGSEIQKKRTIHVAKAGTLSDYISEDEKYQIEELTLTGELNGDDLGFIREMAGKRRITKDDYNYFGDTEGRLMSLDFSGTRLLVGGNSMIVDGIDNYFEYTVTRDNELPPRIFEGCKNLASISIPNSISSIGSYAFSGTTWYNNQPDGVVYIGKVLYAYKGDMPANTNITIKDGTIGIACSAFEYCSNLVSITIPNSVTTIGGIERYPHVYYRGAFVGCTGLTSVTIPNSVNSLGSYTFQNCSSLTSVISEIQNPFEIDETVFYSYDTDIYANATLTVPIGTKAKYQSTEGWKKFQNIVEVAGDEVEFTIDGVTYQGYKSDKVVTVKAVDSSLNSVEIPTSISYDGTNYTVTGIGDNAFVGCTIAALVWDVDNALPSNAFSDTEIGANFLLYVKDASYAPSSISNVIVNGNISTITLSDRGSQFYCPKSFTANTISFTHNYNMETGGNGKGWETIVLPFDVQTIKHRINGEIVPFAAYNQNSGKKPFWLCSFSNNGFVRASIIKANTPYIIAMPNQSSYKSSYVLAGDVTFSAENVTVAATPTFSGKFVPTYSTVKKASNVYAINAVNRYVSETGGYDAGSRFISNLRDVRPFEAYMSDSSTRGIIEIASGDGTTGMDEILGFADSDREIDIYTLNGQKVMQTKQRDLDATIDQLPHGVYIVNGRKIVK